MFGIVCFMNANNSHALVSIKSIKLRGSENLPFVGYCHWEGLCTYQELREVVRRALQRYGGKDRGAEESSMGAP